MAKDTLKNNNILEINSTIGNTTIEVVDPGFATEHRVFSFSGRVKKNIQANVGTLRVDAETNKYFTNTPRLVAKSLNRKNNLESELTLVLTSVERNTNKKAIAYNYNMMLLCREDIPNSIGLNYVLNNKNKTVSSRANGIDRVIIGKKEVKIIGESRQILVYGKAGSTFKLSITEFIDRTPTTLDGGEWIIESFEEDSILSKKTYNSTFSNHLGELNIIDGTINSSGIYSFNQNFPSKTVESRYSINILPTTLSSNFNKSIWNTLRPGWSGWYSQTLYQYINPKLTLRVTSSDAKFSHVNGVVINSSTPYDKVYYGLANRTSSSLGTIKPIITASGGSYLQVFDLEYVILTSSNPLAAIAAHPVLFNPYTPIEDPTTTETEYNSSWTNSNAGNNGGTIVRMSVVSNVLSGSPVRTCTLKLRVSIDRWGTKDTIMAFHLDDHFTPS